MESEFFRYPEKCADKVDKPKPCSICSKVKLCCDAGGYSAVNTKCGDVSVYLSSEN